MLNNIYRTNENKSAFFMKGYFEKIVEVYFNTTAMDFRIHIFTKSLTSTKKKSVIILLLFFCRNVENVCSFQFLLLNMEIENISRIFNV